MSRLPIVIERPVRLGENALFLVGEEREALKEEARLLALLAALEDSDKLQEAEAYTEVEHADKQLRLAKARLEEIQARCKQKAQIYHLFRALWAREGKMLSELEREIATDAHALGAKGVRPELVDCSPAERSTV